jgi:hypothetical protein
LHAHQLSHRAATVKAIGNIIDITIMVRDIIRKTVITAPRLRLCIKTGGRIRAWPAVWLAASWVMSWAMVIRSPLALAQRLDHFWVMNYRADVKLPSIFLLLSLYSFSISKISAKFKGNEFCQTSTIIKGKTS